MIFITSIKLFTKLTLLNWNNINRLARLLQASKPLSNLKIWPIKIPILGSWPNAFLLGILNIFRIKWSTTVLDHNSVDFIKSKQLIMEYFSSRRTTTKRQPFECSTKYHIQNMRYLKFSSPWNAPKWNTRGKYLTATLILYRFQSLVLDELILELSCAFKNALGYIFEDDIKYVFCD